MRGLWGGEGEEAIRRVVRRLETAPGPHYGFKLPGGPSALTEFTNAFLLIYAGLFPIVNPIGSAPIFLGLTSGSTEAERNGLARRVAINSVMLLAGSMFVGSYLLVFFGITLPVVRVAGGMVLIAFAWKLLHTGTDLEDQRTARAEGGAAAFDSFYPLTMPLTVGPGSISVAIALGSQRPAEALHWSRLALLGGAAIAGIVAIAVTVFACYRFARSTIALLGRSGTNVVVRLSAFILLCIGIQILWNGYSALVGH
jgi:multiple antibiotic resistance protein